MLYVFCGDRYSSREHSRVFVDACKKKRPDAEYVFVTENDEPVEHLLFKKSLFDTKYIIFCDELLETNHGPGIIDNLETFVSSPHMFVLFEPQLSTQNQKKFEKKGCVIKKSKEESLSKENSRALFAFTDIFLKQNKEKTFVAFHKLINSKESSTSILNILLWQMRMVCLADKSDNASEAGIKPFVFTKSKKALQTITDPFSILVSMEKIIREKRVQGATDEDIVEYIILSV